MEEIWKEIPIDYCKGHEVSNLGRVRRLSKDGSGYELRVQTPDTKGYLSVSMSLGHQKAHNIKVHRLVAICFLPIPPDGTFKKRNKSKLDGVPYVVNHIDHNKKNNRVDNLEWCDDKHNVNHSSKIGLVAKPLFIKVYDSVEKKELLFYSVKEAARFFGLYSGSLIRVFSLYKNKPYMGRYTFIDYQNSMVPGLTITILDAVNKQIFITDSIAQASSITGVNTSTIFSRVKQKNPTLTSMGGFFFKRGLVSLSDFPYLDPEKAKQERDVLSKRNSMGLTTGNQYPVLVRDEETGHVEEYESLKIACRKLGYSYYNVGYMVRKDKNQLDLSLYDGKQFKFITDERPWTLYSEDEVSQSKARHIAVLSGSKVPHSGKIK